jgi:hypothetical protein
MCVFLIHPCRPTPVHGCRLLLLLQALQGRLAQLLEANAAAPPEEQLGGDALVVHTTQLAAMRSQVCVCGGGGGGGCGVFEC